MEEDLLAGLLGNAPLSATLAQAHGGAAIFWLDRPDPAALTSITLQLIGQPEIVSHEGVASLTRSRVQSDIWALTFDDILAAWRAFAPALRGLTAVGATRFIQTFGAGGPSDGLEEMAGGKKIFRRTADWLIWSRPL